LILVAGVIVSSGCISEKQTTTTILLETTTTLSELEKCMNITDEIEFPWCIIHLAIKKKDSSICADNLLTGFEEDRWYNVCLLWVAKEKGEVTECDNISDLKSVASCYNTIAVKTRNITLCDRIPTGYPIKYRCYLSLRDIADPAMIKDMFSCKKDSDCVGSSCRFSTECINSKFKPDCQGIGFAAVCGPYTIDCCDEVCGCYCINNTCVAILTDGTVEVSMGPDETYDERRKFEIFKRELILNITREDNNKKSFRYPRELTA